MTGTTGSGTVAVVMEGPGALALRRVSLRPVEPADVVVEIDWSGISTGTERLLWSGRMPHFPGMGYPLVPGYESVGTVIDAGPAARGRIGERVFVAGAACFTDARGLFGGAARRLVVPAQKALAVGESLRERAVLLALAATARHAIALAPPDLVVGHGVLGRLVARQTIVAGHAPPVVWETDPRRRSGAVGYTVIDPAADERRQYRTICDVSGSAGILDQLIGRLARGGEIVLAGFYETALSFVFPPAFMKEARLRVAAEWQPDDLAETLDAVADGRLSLDGLITHRQTASEAGAAYETAFGDADCLKMILDWSGCA